MRKASQKPLSVCRVILNSKCVTCAGSPSSSRLANDWGRRLSLVRCFGGAGGDAWATAILSHLWRAMSWTQRHCRLQMNPSTKHDKHVTLGWVLEKTCLTIVTVTYCNFFGIYCLPDLIKVNLAWGFIEFKHSRDAWGRVSLATLNGWNLNIRDIARRIFDYEILKLRSHVKLPKPACSVSKCCQTKSHQ